MKILILVVLSIYIQGSSAQNLTEYILKIDREQPFKVIVKATFYTEVDNLTIHPACPNYDYPMGWSTFIKPLSQNLKFAENATWRITNEKSITYEVDLSFVKDDWEVGNEQAGKYIDNSMFIVTRALFLVSQRDQAFKVTFDLPNDFTIIAPWKETSKNNYLVDSLEKLNNNTIVWGKVGSETIKIEDFTLRFVLLGYEKRINKMVGDTFSEILDEYLKIFPETPESNYLITVFPYEQNDGEAYATSHAFTLKSTPAEENKIIWANQFAHELFHFWNGRMINGPERSKRQWFSEGFTEYFANLSLIRSGVVTESEFFRLIEKTIGPYYFFKQRQYPDVSLVDAGEKKSKYRFGVYNAGWSAAFVMDMMIRERVPDKTLEDYMNSLFVKFGLSGNEYLLADLDNELDKVLGADQDFFSNYISGLQELPVEQYLHRMGIEIDYTPYEATAFLFLTSDQDRKQVFLRDHWLKGNVTSTRKK